MNRFVRVIMLIAILCLLVGCTQSPKGTNNPEPTASIDTLQKLAQEFINQVSTGEYSTASSHFDATMQTMFPENKLKETWEQLIAQVGSYQEQTGIRVDEIQGHQIVTVTCQFENDLLDVQIGFNSQYQIAGLSFAKAQATSPSP